MLKVGGIWVSPVEVENTLIAHEAVLEAAVVGQQDAEKLVKPKAYVVLKDPKDASQELAEELKEFVRNRIAPYKKPWWISFPRFRRRPPERFSDTGSVRAVLADSCRASGQLATPGVLCPQGNAERVHL